MDGCFRRAMTGSISISESFAAADALVVVDTRADLSEADELLAIWRTFGRPVRWVVNSHWHFDHVFGAISASLSPAKRIRAGISTR